MSKCTCEYEPNGHGNEKRAVAQGKGGYHCPIHGASDFALGPLILPPTCSCEWTKDEAGEYGIRDINPECRIHNHKKDAVPCLCKSEVIERFPLQYCYGWMSFTRASKRNPMCPRHRKYKTLNEINKFVQCSCGWEKDQEGNWYVLHDHWNCPIHQEKST